MSSWLRWVNNTAANFNLSKSIRATSNRFMGRSDKQLRKESNKPNEYEQSCQSSESNCVASCSTSSASRTTSGTASSGSHAYTRTTASSASTTCGSGSSASKFASAKERAIPIHASGCSCSLCRDYDDYTSTVGTKGQRTCSRIRDSFEPRAIKQAYSTTTDPIERCTGIPTGVTI